MTKKEIAIACLEELDIYGPYVRKLQSKAGIPCFFEDFGGFYADQEPELWKKIKEVESRYDCLVYAITHERFEFGDCWSLLCVNSECEEVQDCLDKYGHKSYYVFAYVWNQTNPWLSEFGDVAVQKFGGGIRRIG